MERKTVYTEVTKIYREKKSTHEIVKEEKEIRANIAVTLQPKKLQPQSMESA